MKFVHFLTLFFLLNSCSHDKYIGLYGKCGKNYLSCNQLYLEKNNEFTYYEYWDVGGVGNKVKGKWTVVNDTLTLNSYIQAQDRIDSVIELRNEINDSITFMFYDNSDPDFAWVIMQINNNDSAYQSNFYDGIMRIPNNKIIDSISFKTIGFTEHLHYTIADKNSNYFKIYFSAPKINFYFTNEKWLIKDKKLFTVRNSDGNYDMMYYKKKTPKRNKVF